jgi:hypothetical protein
MDTSDGSPERDSSVGRLTDEYGGLDSSDVHGDEGR